MDYYAVVAFEASDGSKHCVTSDIGVWSKPKIEIGRKYTVLYNPEDPKDAHIDTASNIWLPSLVCLLMGGVTLFAFFHPDHRH